MRRELGQRHAGRRSCSNPACPEITLVPLPLRAFQATWTGMSLWSLCCPEVYVLHVVLSYFSSYNCTCFHSVCLSSGPKEVLGISSPEPGRVELTSGSPSSGTDLRMERQRQTRLFSSSLQSCSASLLLVASALGLLGGLLRTVSLKPGNLERLKACIRGLVPQEPKV